MRRALLVVLLLTACTSPTHRRAAPPPSPSTEATTASPTATVTPSPSASPGPAGPAFHSTDVSFVSITRGWALGKGQLLGTADGGRTWTRLPTPPADVTQLRFASAAVGYAWAPGGSLSMTTDGGAHWLAGGLAMVGSVEIAHGVVWAIAGENPYPGVWRATVASTHFVKLGTTPNRSGTLDVHGAVAYVMGEQGAGPIAPALDIWRVGAAVRDQKLPCVRENVYVPGSPLGVSTDGTVLLVCVIEDNGHSIPKAYLSHDEARTWTPTPAPAEVPRDVTAVRGRLFAWGKNLTVQDGQTWSTSLRGNGFVLVGFQDDAHGVALGADGVLHLTRDAGRTWTIAELAA